MHSLWKRILKLWYPTPPIPNRTSKAGWTPRPCPKCSGSMHEGLFYPIDICVRCGAFAVSGEEGFTQDPVRKRSEGEKAARYFGVIWGNRNQRDLAVRLYSKRTQIGRYR